MVNASYKLWMDIFHNLGISVHKCLFLYNFFGYVFHCQVFFIWCLYVHFSDVYTWRMFSVSSLSEHIQLLHILHAPCLFLFLGVFLFVCLGVSSLASLSHFCGTDFVKNILLCFTVLSSLLCLYVVGFCYQEIWWLHICVWGVVEIKWCNAVCGDRLLVNWEF